MPQEASIRIQWLGDIALTAQFLHPANHNLLEANCALLAKGLEPSDLRIANWEAPLIGEDGVTQAKRMALYTDEETARKVLGIKLDVAILANNHAFDCFESGFRRTANFLQQSGIRVVGAGLSPEEAAAPISLQVNGTPITLLAYVDEDTNPQVPPQTSMYLNMLHRDHVLRDVARWAREDRVVIVHFHMGHDFMPIPSPRQRRLARDVSEAGAKVVVCYHPHRIQGYEKHQNGHIIYSLGNALVGTIYPWPRITEPTLAITCELTGREVTRVSVQPFLLRNGRLRVDSGNRVVRELEQRQKIYSATEVDYDRIWAKALAKDLFLTRPVHFLRRNRNPWRAFGSLRTRHLHEYARLLREIAKRILGKRPVQPG
ncbi:MAG: CapA family protein [Thermodesulfobacteriota bacterium]